MRIEHRDKSHPWEKKKTYVKKVLCFSNQDRAAFARVAKLMEKARELRGPEGLEDDVDHELAGLEMHAEDMSQVLEYGLPE
tara:strand:- start:52 stop:294 length:243 start_codon:yes stop_codon:yes gene_type:complete